MRNFFLHSVFALYLLALVAAAWWPLDFAAPTSANFQIESFQPGLLTRRWNLEKDVLKLAMFIPIGIFFVMGAGSCLSGWKRVGRALGWGAALSVLLQAGRLFLPGRFPLMGDLVMNTAGLAIGASVIGLPLLPRRVLLVLWLGCAFGFVLAATWPGHFSREAAIGVNLASRVEWSPFEGHFSMGVLRERMLNALVLLPLGLLAASYAWRGRAGVLRALLIATAIGFATSLTVELLQCFLPYRTPSLSDLVLNTLGTLLGGAMAAAIERWAGDRPRTG